MSKSVKIKDEKQNGSTIELGNPYLNEMESDFMYHLGLGTENHNLPEMFGDVQFVVMGGTPQRMQDFAYFIKTEIGYKTPTGTQLIDISKDSHRYAMYKVGPVLAISHGMGIPSFSILLHEVIKLLSYAGAKDPVFFRLGTCGGVGLEGGIVVVTDEAVDGTLKPQHENIILGRKICRPTKINKEVTNDLIEIGSTLAEFETVTGKTMATDDFYEGQGRLDGAFCEYNLQDKMDYLKKLHENGVRNIEMESTVFAALTHKAGIKAAVVCVTLLNRLNGDQILTPKDVMKQWQQRPQILIAEYIKSKLPAEQIVNGTRRRTLSGGEYLKGNTSQLFTRYEDFE